MEISREEWDRHQADRVTLEWFKLFRERQRQIETLIPALIATGTTESIGQARVASGRHQELDDLLNTRYDDMKGGE